MRLRASNGLSTDTFAVEPLRLGREWQNVELTEEVGKVLDTYAGSHIDIHPNDIDELKRVGREVNDAGRVVKVETAPKAKAAAKGDAK